MIERFKPKKKQQKIMFYKVFSFFLCLNYLLFFSFLLIVQRHFKLNLATNLCLGWLSWRSPITFDSFFSFESRSDKTLTQKTRVKNENENHFYHLDWAGLGTQFILMAITFFTCLLILHSILQLIILGILLGWADLLC